MLVNLSKAGTLKGEDSFAAYGALDTTGTLEIFNTLYSRLTPEQHKMYEWSLAQQAPAIAMTARGVRVDQFALKRAQDQVNKDLIEATNAIRAHPLVVSLWDGKQLNTGKCKGEKKKKITKKAALALGLPEGVREVPVVGGLHKWPRAKKGEPALPTKGMVCEVCAAPRELPKPFEPSSSPQCNRLFFTLLLCQPRYNKDGGLTTDDEALESIGEDCLVRDPQTGKKKKLPEIASLVEAIRNFRDLSKQLVVLNAKLSEDNRYHSSFNVAAPWTARWSSSKDPFQRGGNLQNVSERLRDVFCADPGMEMFYADLKTAESLLVAYTAGDEAYIEAHKGDVHTWVTRELWPELPWTGDIKKDKKIASSTNPPWDTAPGHDYRFQSKRVQHGPLAEFMEVLTPQGWAEVRNLPQTIATWDATGEVRMEAVGWVEGEAASLVLINGRNVKQVVSPDHRLPRINNGKLGEILAGDVDKKFGRWPTTGTRHGGAFDPFAKLRAASWADGTLEKAYPNSVRFSVAKERKAIRLRELCAELGLKLWESFSGGQWHMRVYGFHIKALSWDMLTWDTQSRAAFLAELPLWDGSAHNGQLRVFNTDLEGMSIIQAICHTTAKSANINQHGKPRDNEVQCYQLTISNRSQADWAGVKFAYASCGSRPAKVYCPRTTRGWVLTRYKGVVSVTGNSNYGLTPHGMAIIARIPRKAAAEAQERYFTSFPRIKAWHDQVAGRVRNQLPLYNCLRRMVRLFGRPGDPHTFKQGLAFGPQSGVGDILNCGLWRVWNECDPHLIQCLAQVHDAVLGQWPIKKREEAIAALKRLMAVPVPVMDINGVTRECIIQVEVAAGQNWKHATPDNPRGIQEV